MNDFLQKKYRFYNILFGWTAFLIALVVYLLTIEPTVSFWDCGEFIASSYKLEVGHPPGAPFFMLLGRFFTIFAGSAENAAKMMNIMSASASAFTILFLFWTITHLARKIFMRSGEMISTGKIIAVIGSGLIGALAYTFSDTFWFSATEAEVYATSSLFTAVVFWAILKWENEFEKKHSLRWLILIAYLVGLSIGVHLLNLLAIPAIVLVFYYKKYKPSTKGVIGALLVSFLILGAIMYIIIPGFVNLMAPVERMFVNSFGMPYYSGMIAYLVIVVGLIVWGIRYTYKKRKVLLNNLLVGLTVILIGYSSYALIVIRSQADPPMDQNDPENVFNLLSYLNREQYGDRPLFYGHYFNAPVKEREQGKPIYQPVNGKYKIVDYKTKLKYDDRFTGFFPRMYSSESQHVKDYKNWVNIDGKKVTVRSRGEAKKKTVPGFDDNLAFFLKYQVGHMYLRYFMWNFSGRQNDIQGHGNIRDGNWISGIPFIDNSRLKDQEQLPDYLKNNPGRNMYYMLPLLLGIIGLIYHSSRQRRDFFVVLILFIFTGLAIVYYLNQYPHQPRERDYAYAGSFYAFSIWIGFAVLAVYEGLKKLMNAKVSAMLSFLVLLPVPLLMASENWDDHDRSGRYTARDFATNYLNSCRKNAVLFTNGDNDTFPLWYAQEVEGVRTDVRVANLSYLRAGWYVEQMTRKAYESDPLPLTHTREQLMKGKREVVPIYNQIKKPVSLMRIVQFVANDDERTKIPSPFVRGEKSNYIPSKKYKLKIDKQQILKNNVVEKEDSALIVDEMQWSINRNYLMKDGLTILDLLATNNWERPIHFSVTVTDRKYFNLDKYFWEEGLAYHLKPMKTSGQGIGEVNTDRMYNILMNKFKWGGVDTSELYLNQDNRRMLKRFRNSFGTLANKCMQESKPDSARKVMDYCLNIISDDVVAYDFTVMSFIRNYYRLGDLEKAKKHADLFLKNVYQEMDYYLSIGGHTYSFMNDLRRNLYILKQMNQITRRFGTQEEANEIQNALNRYMKALQGKQKG